MVSSSRAAPIRLPFTSQIYHNLIIEPYESIELGLEEPFLIAVHSESLWPVLEIDRRADPIALHPLRAQLRHIGRKRAHRRQRRHVINASVCRLDRLEGRGVLARR